MCQDVAIKLGGKCMHSQIDKFNARKKKTEQMQKEPQDPKAP